MSLWFGNLVGFYWGLLRCQVQGGEIFVYDRRVADIISSGLIISF